MTALTSILDGAIFFAILTQAVSLTDFILLPKQKKILEGWCDNITLRLEFLNIASFMQTWLRASRRAHIGEVLFGIISIVAVLGPAGFVGFLVFSNGFSWLGVGLVLLILVLQAWCWSQSAKVFEVIGHGAFKVLEEASGIKQFLVAYVIMAAGGLLAIAVIGVLFYWTLEHIDHGGFVHFIVKLLGNFYIGFIVTWLVLFVDGVITLTMAMLLWPVRLVVVASRWFMWRVSSYPKGPLAALVAVSGGIIAIIRISVTD